MYEEQQHPPIEIKYIVDEGHTAIDKHLEKYTDVAVGLYVDGDPLYRHVIRTHYDVTQESIRDMKITILDYIIMKLGEWEFAVRKEKEDWQDLADG